MRNSGRLKLPLDDSLRYPYVAENVDASMNKLLRLLTLVELIPIEADDEEEWATFADLCRGLKARGIRSSMRTIQRDVHFVTRHFLVMQRTGSSGKRKLQRLESHEWQTSFCPRLPGSECDIVTLPQPMREVMLTYPHRMGRA